MALGRSHPRLFLALSRIASKTNGPQNFILTHTCLLKNTYEQNLAHCIGAPQRADFFSLFLIPDPMLMIVAEFYIGSGISLNPYIIYKYKKIFLQPVVVFLYYNHRLALG